ncbi:MAG: hypothetical protein RL429_301, partial [Bacteroidota bacterium]
MYICGINEPETGSTSLLHSCFLVPYTLIGMASMPDLSDRKLPELKELAESLGVPKARYLRKPELLEAIQQLGERGGASSAPATESVDAPAQEGRRRGRPARTESQSGEAATVAGEASGEGERPQREDRPRREGWEDRGARSERSDRGPREEREPREDRGPRDDRPRREGWEDRGPRQERGPLDDRGPREDRPRREGWDDRGPRDDR